MGVVPSNPLFTLEIRVCQIKCQAVQKINDDFAEGKFESIEQHSVNRLKSLFWLTLISFS